MRFSLLLPVSLHQVIVTTAASDYLKSIPSGLRGASSIQDCSQSQPQFIPAIPLVENNDLRFPLRTNNYYASLLWKRCNNAQYVLVFKALC
jgi:endoglucanase Acf2